MVERILRFLAEADSLKEDLAGNEDEAVKLLLERLKDHPAVKALQATPQSLPMIPYVLPEIDVAGTTEIKGWTYTLPSTAPFPGVMYDTQQ